MNHMVDAHVAYIKTISDLNQDKAKLLERIKRLEEELTDTKNKHAVLVADVVLDEDRAERIKRLEDSYAAKDAQLSNLLHICRDNDIEVSSYDLIHGKEAKR